ncbi:MAG TPA: condensation domain-containing protein, partial [Herpetosiphonaceae bacterium]
MFDELSRRIAALSPEQRAVFEQRLKQRGLQAPSLQTIPKRPESSVVPLSFGQQRLWFLDQLEPRNPSYNGPSAVELSGPLDIAVLERSLNEVVRRHESLRTTFAAVDDQPVQVIAPTLRLPLRQIDLRSYPAAEREAEAQRRAQAEFQQPFDLQAGPLLRAALLQLDDAEFLLLFTMHHIITDGWSTELLVEEVATLYAAFVAGQPSPLPELPIQYADFALWQREQLQGAALEQQIAYWTRQLDGAPALLSLPTDRPRPAVQSHRGAVQAFELPPALSAALAALSQQEGVTLFMLLLAAFNVLLQRYSGQDDILVGTSVSGRSRNEIARVMGFFANNLALRTDLTGRPSFRELVQRVRTTALGAYAHQELPFELLVEELNPER